VSKTSVGEHPAKASTATATIFLGWCQTGEWLETFGGLCADGAGESEDRGGSHARARDGWMQAATAKLQVKSHSESTWVVPGAGIMGPRPLSVEDAFVLCVVR